ncbi:hypothetical protein [Streptosporangium sp. NPDC006930]|uniref:hypothetical protein n=1 Tax=Streptosporangium sp. NPDC006930 TaxID=3154783 RepID=UPI00341D98B0
MKENELTGQAREYYNDWRKLGLSESAALSEVERSGILDEDQLTEGFKSLGLSPEAARIAAQGRGEAAAQHPFDQAVSLYERMGLSPSAAKVAVIGRGGTEAQVRAEMGELAKESRDVRIGQDETAQLKAAFNEAVSAAKSFYSWRDDQAEEWIKNKIHGEYAAMSVTEGIAALRRYARVFGSQEPLLLEKGIVKRSAAGRAPLTERRTERKVSELVELREVDRLGIRAVGGKR